MFTAERKQKVQLLLKRQGGNWWTDRRVMKCVHESEPFRAKQGLNMSQIQENLRQRFRLETFFPSEDKESEARKQEQEVDI